MRCACAPVFENGLCYEKTPLHFTAVKNTQMTFLSMQKLILLIGAMAAIEMAEPAAVRAAETPLKIGLKTVASGFVSPSVLAPIGDGRMLVADQVGTIHLLNKDGTVREELFLDLRSRLTKLNQGFDERGLLGLALHPRFIEDGRFFVYYSAPRRAEAPEGWDHTSHISEFKAAGADRSKADIATERVLLQIDQPQFNHNSGRMTFGPDGYLYIGVGDGGQANDEGLGHSPQGNGQDTSNLLGKILRIDVDKGTPYAVPSDNPFAKGGGRPEIYAYGLRNPWGISFDRGGQRELFAADVGQDRFEEVNIIVNGGNYGWRIREAFDCFDPKSPTKPPADCPKVGADGKPLLDPIVAYKNSKGFRKEGVGTSVTGGYVYRGKALPQLAGRYVFADWSRNWVLPDGVLWVATRPSAGGAWTLDSLPVATNPKGTGAGAYVVALGEDAEGELYVLTNGSNSLIGKTGKVSKIVSP